MSEGRIRRLRSHLTADVCGQSTFPELVKAGQEKELDKLPGPMQDPEYEGKPENYW